MASAFMTDQHQLGSPRHPRARRDEPCDTVAASEDFAFMLQKKRGTYCLLGNGDTPMVHHPQYAFDDDILPKGAANWVALTERYLRES